MKKIACIVLLLSFITELSAQHSKQKELLKMSLVQNIEEKHIPEKKLEELRVEFEPILDTNDWNTLEALSEDSLISVETLQLVFEEGDIVFPKEVLGTFKLERNKITVVEKARLKNLTLICSEESILYAEASFQGYDFLFECEDTTKIGNEMWLVSENGDTVKLSDLVVFTKDLKSNKGKDRKKAYTKTISLTPHIDYSKKRVTSEWIASLKSKYTNERNEPILLASRDVELKCAEIYCSEGVVWRIVLHTQAGDEFFYNQGGNYSLYRFDKERRLTLLSNNNNKEKRIWEMVIGDAINYTQNAGRFSFPDDTTITLWNKDRHDTASVYRKSSLRSYITARAYTDMLTLSDNAENGLVLFEGQARFILNQYPRRGRRWYIFHYARPYMELTKFGTEESYVPVSLQDSLVYAPDAFSKSKVGFGLDINLFDLLMEYGSISVNGGARVDHAALALDQEVPVFGSAYLTTFYGNVWLRVFESDNLGLEFNIGYYWQEILDNSTVADITVRQKQSRYVIPEFIFYVGGKRTLGSAFLRVNHKHSIDHSKRSFTNFHLGYNIKFNIPRYTF